MRPRKTFALTAAILSLGVPVATAAPDGYQPDAIDRYLASNGPDGFQPQLHASGQPDAIDRYLANNAPDGFQPQLHASAQPDAVDRHVANVLRQAELPAPTGAGTAADRPDGGSTSRRSAALGMLGGALIVLLAFIGASALRGRRSLVLR